MALQKKGAAPTAAIEQPKASRLATIQRGPQPGPPRGIIYGQEKIGKSTIPCYAPAPIFIPTEERVELLDVAKFPVAESYNDVIENLKTLLNEDHEFGTVVIDSLDWLEKLTFAHVCRKYNVSQIEKVEKGFGKGYRIAAEHINPIIDLLSQLRNKKRMCFVGICHSQVESFEDPTSAMYKRYSPQLNKWGLAVWAQWVDFILFATFKTVVKIEDGGFNKSRGIAQNIVGKDGVVRILRTVQSPAALAGNAYQFEPELSMGTAANPTGWAEIEAGIGNYLAKQDQQDQQADEEPIVVLEEPPREPGDDDV